MQYLFQMMVYHHVRIWLLKVQLCTQPGSENGLLLSETNSWIISRERRNENRLAKFAKPSASSEEWRWSGSTNSLLATLQEPVQWIEGVVRRIQYEVDDRRYFWRSRAGVQQVVVLICMSFPDRMQMRRLQEGPKQADMLLFLGHWILYLLHDYKATCYQRFWNMKMSMLNASYS